MPFTFRDLDERTRRFMVEEIEAGTRGGNLYESKRFTDAGRAAWPGLLLEAARAHDEQWLTREVETQGLMKAQEGARTPSGGYTIKDVSRIAAETLAEGQFSRYYILGVCRRAQEEGKPRVTAYRAKEVASPRAKSAALIGTALDVGELIAALRPVESSLKHDLVQPNSGLSVHL